jgi:hypothetical protein
MRKLTSIVLAGAIAATAIAATATGASAGNWNGGNNWNGNGNWNNNWHGPYKHKPHIVYRNTSPDVGGALFAGALFGLAVGAIASQPDPYPYYVEPAPQVTYLPPPRPAYPPVYTQNLVASNDHYAWCKSNYRSYNAERDTFIDFQGIERPCVTPYE